MTRALETPAVMRHSVSMSPAQNFARPVLVAASLVAVVLAGCSSSQPEQIRDVFTSFGAQVKDPPQNLHRFDGLQVYEANVSLSGDPATVAAQINGDLAAIGVSVECDGSPAALPFEMTGQKDPPDMECVLSGDRGRYYLTQNGEVTNVTAVFN